MEDRVDLLGGLSISEFLEKYWQKQPLLIRQAIPGFQSPLSPDELAGLACEDEVESRIVIEKDGDHPWQLLYGPFDDESFSQMPENHWTLLVQETNKHLPEMAELMDRFNFIPSWRVDDVMVSYAADQGSVGPHLDNYDVFLLQGHGQRRWQISDRAYHDDELSLIPEIELGILQSFAPDQEWVLEPGDMLYLPPRFVHHGVALGDCMTLSIGFRSQSHAELLTGYMEHVVENLAEDFRYSDPDLQLQQHPGEITSQQINKIRTILQQHLTMDDQQLARWFGCNVTEPASSYDEPLPRTTMVTEQTFLALFEQQQVLLRYPRSRFAFSQSKQETLLFVNGHRFALSPSLTSLAALLCDQRLYSFNDFSPLMKETAALQFLTRLFNEGYLTTDE